MTAPFNHAPARPVRENTVGDTALARGILAVITSALLAGLLFGSLAVTLGLAGLDAVAEERATNRKSAIAAVVLGVVAIVISLVSLVYRIWRIV
ncbi:hypothetical protein [Mycobacterium sp. URHB0021]|jgi:hypothetical protein